MLVDPRWPAGVALLLLSGCSGGGASGAGGASVRDSAGVQIVENSGPGWAEGSGWRLEGEPLVSIGGSDTDPAYDFGRPLVVLLPEGRLAVGNGLSLDVRLYDSTGRHLVTSGRRGSGPGEYQIIAAVYPGAGDSLLVMDIVQRRLSVLAPEGAWVRSFSLAGQSGGMMPMSGSASFAVPMGWLTDGTVPGSAQVFRMDDPRDGPYRDTLTVILFGPDGAARDTVGRFPGMELEQIAITMGTQSGRAPSAVPLGRNTLMAAAGGRMVIAPNQGHWEVEERDARGRLIRLIRVVVEPVAITEADARAHRQEQLDLMLGAPEMRAIPEQFRTQIEDRINKARYPATFPWIGGLRLDDGGYLWVQEVPRPGHAQERHAVFDPEGILLGTLTLPPRFRLADVRGDRLAGVWRDEDEVEHVRVYRIVR